MDKFLSLLEEVKTIAKSITKEQFEQDLKEYEKIYNKKE